MKLLSDTSDKVRAIHEEMLRRRTPEESFRTAQQLTQFVHQLAFDNLRAQHPELTEEEAWLKLAAERLGADVVRKVNARRAKAS
ncbi:MAG TPA: hypothetical protein VGF28_08090 [Thermoanaerobaculia bacterium]|jgi:hypothetical protein